MNIHDWAMRWGIPAQAMSELLTMPLPDSVPTQQTEAAVQVDTRLEASRNGNILWRNNNGAGMSDDGRYLRWGLGNDSKKINDEFKSSDLIGITPVTVAPYHVGRIFGIFTAVEVKRGNWSWSGNEREQAQWKYLQLVNSKGGFATFARSIEDYKACIRF